MLTIERLQAIAKLDDPAATLRYAASEAVRGDDSWGQWVREFDRGEALIVRLEMTLTADDGGAEIVEVHNGGLFVESDVHPPLLEQQIAEVATKDFGVIVHELRRRGHCVSADELDGMYVHVQLAHDLRGALRRAASSQAIPQGNPRSGVLPAGFDCVP